MKQPTKKKLREEIAYLKNEVIKGYYCFGFVSGQYEVETGLKIIREDIEKEFTKNWNAKQTKKE